jgi:hypothetical protein
MKVSGGFLRAFALALISAGFLMGCAKDQRKHAPVCPYGQVLTYNDSGYVCQFANVGMSGYQNPYSYNNYNMYNQQGGMGMVQAPISACPIANQVLVNWRGQWLCYNNDQIYPGGGDSPVGMIPPPGRGGEFCTSVGQTSQWGNTWNQWGNNNSWGNNSYSVTCSPGFQCVAQQQQIDPNNPNQVQQNYGVYGYGQSGTCQYGNGYRQF